MARYKVLAKSHINSRIYAEGEEVEYSGEPDENLEPLDDAAREAFAKRADFKADRAAKAEAHARFVENLKKGGAIDDLV